MPILVNNVGASGDFEKVLIPPGAYKATLANLKVEDKPSIDNPAEPVATLVWFFEIVGKTKTVTIEHWSGATASLSNEKSWTRRFFRALTGGEPPVNDGQTDLEELLGLTCNIRVDDHTTKKGDKVSKIKDAWALERPGEASGF